MASVSVVNTIWKRRLQQGETEVCGESLPPDPLSLSAEPLSSLPSAALSPTPVTHNPWCVSVTGAALAPRQAGSPVLCSSSAYCRVRDRTAPYTGVFTAHSRYTHTGSLHRQGTHRQASRLRKPCVGVRGSPGGLAVIYWGQAS